MIWPGHAESSCEDRTILIETNLNNRLDPWLTKRINLYKRKGKRVHLKLFRAREFKKENKNETSTSSIAASNSV